MGIEVTMVDASEWIGMAAHLTHRGSIRMRSVSQMVLAVLAYTGSRRIDRLNIIDHGSPRRMQFGDDRVDLTNLSTFAPEFERLSSLFSPSGFVHLQHCRIGLNAALLVRFSKIVGAPVYAGTGAHNSTYRFNRGHYVCAYPDGRWADPAPRP